VVETRHPRVSNEAIIEKIGTPSWYDLRAARGEGAAVVDAVDGQGDSPRRVAGAQEVAVHRMRHAIVAGRPVRGDDGLGQHLAPKMRPVGIGWEAR
jgi:hypothetical protein